MTHRTQENNFLTITSFLIKDVTREEPNENDAYSKLLVEHSASPGAPS